jgi:4'-phosphopantetheinyl transferase
VVGAATDGVVVWRSRAPEIDRARTRLLARATLRLALAAHLGGPPERFRFTLGRWGKPELVPFSGWHVNVAHSGRDCAVALTRLGPVGVDVEEVPDALPDLEPIARRRFSPAEVDEILRCTGPQRILAFVRAWTRTEARLKASGHGLLGFDRGVHAAATLDADLRAEPSMVGAVAVVAADQHRPLTVTEVDLHAVMRPAGTWPRR